MRIPETAPGLPEFQRGESIQVVVDGRIVQAFKGELVSTVLHADGVYIYGRKPTTGRISGLYCGMGICYECLVTIDGVPNTRACQTYAADQMTVETSVPHGQ